jgi:hypothetical protein
VAKNIIANFPPGSDRPKVAQVPALNSQPSTLNSVSQPSTLNSARPFIPPILLIRSLAERAFERFPEFRLTLGNIREWALQAIGLQRKCAEDTRAIDDPLERSDILDRIETLAATASRNDPPAVRRQLRRACRELRTAYAEIHARTEQVAREITPEVQFPH